MPRRRAVCALIVSVSALAAGARADELPPLSVASAPGPGTAPLDLRADREPSLHEATLAAARAAAQSPLDDEQRLLRARRSHWLPLFRAQMGGRDDQRLKVDSVHGYLTLDDGSVTSLNWTVAASWDLSQLWFAKEEVSLALLAARLSRLRQAAVARAAQLYVKRHLFLRPPAGPEVPSERAHRIFEVLAATAELDGLTQGLFAGALERAQAAAVLLMQSDNLEAKR